MVIQSVIEEWGLQVNVKILEEYLKERKCLVEWEENK
jgi:hypothetical protein